MPDNAIAAGVNPPDPMQGMNVYNAMLGARLKRQELQTGQYLQQTAQAGASQSQQDLAERNAVMPVLHNPDQYGLLDADGVIRPEKVIPLLQKLAPKTNGTYIEPLMQGFRAQLDVSQEAQKLNEAQRADAYRTMAGISQDSSVKTYTDFVDRVSAAEDQNPKLKPFFAKALQHFNPTDSLDVIGAKAKGFARTIIPPKENLPQPSSLDIGGQVITGTTEPGSGAFAASGQQIQKTLSPSEQPSYRAQVAGATARQVASGNADIDRANEVGNLQQQSSAALPLTRRIDELAHEISSGHLAKMISESGNYLGFSSVNEARSQLNKDLGQVKGLAVSKAGSDSRAATILEGYPTDTTPEGTIHAAMDYIRGTARQNLARGRLLSQYQKSDPQGMRGFQAADNVLGGSTDPLMHEYLALKPSEQAAFYRRNFSSAIEAQDFKDRVNALKKHSRVFE